MIIEHYPNYPIQLFNNQELFECNKIDLNLAIKRRLGNQTLTDKIALKLLNEEKIHSDIQSLFFNPLCARGVTLLTTVISAYGIWSAPVLVTANVAFLTFCTIGLASCFVYSCLNGKRLRGISEAWKAQSQKATEYINILESPQNSLLCLQ